MSRCLILVSQYFARDPDFIQSFAKHNITGESIPTHILDCVLQENSRFSVLETVQQIIYALVDLHLHTHNNEVGNTRMDTSGWSRKVAYEATGEKRYIRYIEDCDWHASLSHLGMYGSNYYSYLWCKVRPFWSSCPPLLSLFCFQTGLLIR